MKKKVIGMVVVLVILAGSVVGVTLVRNGKNNAVKYRKEALSRGDIEAVVVTSGALKPIVLVDVGSQVSGKIVKLYVDFNSMVKQGQIVAELDTKPLKLQVEQNDANYKSAVAATERAKATLDQLKRQYERSVELFNKKLLSPQDKDTAEANYLGARADVMSAEAHELQAKAQLDQSQVNLDYAIIRSPADGMVINKEVSEGQTLQASFSAPVLYEIATDLTKMKVECSVDEADIGKVKEGQKVRFTVEAYPNDTFNGTVQQVQYQNQTVSNVVTYTTVVNVENPELKLRPGMTATATIIVGEAKNVLRVPNSALRFSPPQNVIDAAIKEMRDRMAAQRSAQGGQGGPSGADPQGQGFATGMRSGGGQGGSRRQASRVWVQDKNGNVRMIFIRTGITDNTYTEILRAELKEADEVITGQAGPNTTTATAQQPGRGPGGPGMFIGR
jgi:HlyD family secretion protein